MAKAYQNKDSKILVVDIKKALESNFIYGLAGGEFPSETIGFKDGVI